MNTHYELETKTSRRDWRRLTAHYDTQPAAIRDLNKRTKAHKTAQYIEHFSAPPPEYRIVKIQSIREILPTQEETK